MPKFSDFYSLIFKKLAEASEDIIFLYDQQKNYFIEVNDSLERLWHISKNELNEKPSLLVDLVHQSDKGYVFEKFEELNSRGNVQNFEFKIRGKDYQDRWVCLEAYIIQTENTPLIFGFARDISKNKQYMTQLLNINSKKNSTLEILSHDLAGPLHSIQILTEFVENKNKKYDKTSIEKFTELIKETCKRSIDLITDFVNQEFLESVAIYLKKERIDIIERIRSIIDHYKVSENDIQKRFELLCDKDHFWMEIDDIKFMQVINNLISNAIKFTKDDGLIKITLLEDEYDFIIKVEDNGIGIPEKFQPYLFDKFTKARRPGIRGEKSVGLGMSIIKTIVELHKGTIDFISKENSGTTFTIKIPKTN
jgi:two-component system, OmpR family, sensor histidine kinase VicK